MHPVAVLQVDRLGVTEPVLTGASGSSLAFGIGHLHGTAPPNGEGHAVLAGHRDTRLAFLQDLRIGDRIELKTHAKSRQWQVEEVRVVSQHDGMVTAPTEGDRLTLITCYPFDGLFSSTWRFVVSCLPVAPAPVASRPPEAA